MSTFNGVVHEFPDIPIDYFRTVPGRPPPLACFLSHVHSDHIAGLESLRSPFVYCSAATRAILLQLEKRANRISCANGLQEVPIRTYKHLKNVLKSIPLETPVEIELPPHDRIQVTLFDANHCPGAVMFLIEGHGKAVLYTGDIRSEPWWVNSIARNPSLVEYTFGLKTLDRIYLDTSMLDDITLQTKSQGLQHLLSQVVRYPQDTIFCMQAWTFGYEEVWIALSKALQSKIHVDGYKMRVYQSLVHKSGNERFPLLSYHSKEAPYLVGFSSGRKQFEGCLTCDENVRIHSCEKDTPCDVMRKKPVVWIRPVVALLPNGEDVNEVGLGGGGDDLEQEVDLAQMATDNFDSLLQLITESRDLSIESKKEIKLLLMTLVGKEHSQNESMTDLKDIDNRLGGILGSMIRLSDERQRQDNQGQDESSLPRRITFPYARHSAYPELRHLVETFRPKDVWPNTVDLPKWAERDITMRKLFGASCSGTEFQHDFLVQGAMQELRQAQQVHSQEDVDTQTTASLEFSSPMTYNGACGANQPTTQTFPLERKIKTKSDHVERTAVTIKGDSMRKRVHEDLYSDESDATDDSHLFNLAENDPRHRAFHSMTRNLSNETWQPIHLISTTDHHTDLEAELGHQ